MERLEEIDDVTDSPEAPISLSAAIDRINLSIMGEKHHPDADKFINATEDYIEDEGSEEDEDEYDDHFPISNSQLKQAQSRYPCIINPPSTCKELRVACTKSDLDTGRYKEAMSSPYLSERRRRYAKMCKQREEAILVTCIVSKIQMDFQEIEFGDPCHVAGPCFSGADPAFTTARSAFSVAYGHGDGIKKVNNK